MARKAIDRHNGKSELAGLRSEIRQLRQENELLKMAVISLAPETGQKICSPAGTKRLRKSA